jgi:hypothetical protein
MPDLIKQNERVVFREGKGVEKPVENPVVPVNTSRYHMLSKALNPCTDKVGPPRFKRFKPLTVTPAGA